MQWAATPTTPASLGGSGSTRPARHTVILDLPSHASEDPNGIERRAWDGISVNMPWEGPAFVGAFNAE